MLKGELGNGVGNGVGAGVGYGVGEGVGEAGTGGASVVVVSELAAVGRT
jgi:hypothetical protein